MYWDNLTYEAAGDPTSRSGRPRFRCWPWAWSPPAPGVGAAPGRFSDRSATARTEPKTPRPIAGFSFFCWILPPVRRPAFVNGANSPTLRVGRLEGDVLEGSPLAGGSSWVAVRAWRWWGLASGSLPRPALMIDLLYGVSPADPATFLAVSALLGTSALVACYVPARRAMRVNPVDVLRHE